MGRAQPHLHHKHRRHEPLRLRPGGARRTSWLCGVPGGGGGEVGDGGGNPARENQKKREKRTERRWERGKEAAREAREPPAGRNGSNLSFQPSRILVFSPHIEPDKRALRRKGKNPQTPLLLFILIWMNRTPVNSRSLIDQLTAAVAAEVLKNGANQQRTSGMWNKEFLKADCWRRSAFLHFCCFCLVLPECALLHLQRVLSPSVVWAAAAHGQLLLGFNFIYQNLVNKCVINDDDDDDDEAGRQRGLCDWWVVYGSWLYWLMLEKRGGVAGVRAWVCARVCVSSAAEFPLFCAPFACAIMQLYARCVAEDGAVFCSPLCACMCAQNINIKSLICRIRVCAAVVERMAHLGGFSPHIKLFFRCFLLPTCSRAQICCKYVRKQDSSCSCAASELQSQFAHREMWTWRTCCRKTKDWICR